MKQEPEESEPAEVNDGEPASAAGTSTKAEPEVYSATYEEEIKRLKSEEIWIEQSICMRYHVDKATASRLIDAYYRYLVGECSEEHHRNFGHAKSHFHSWYRKAAKAGFSLDPPEKTSDTPDTTRKQKPPKSSDYTFKGGFGGQDA